MMPLRNLLYLLQLEEYDLKRFDDWIRQNSDRVVLEKKKHIDWTLKIKMIFVLANIFNIFVNAKLALEISIKILSPVDSILKKSLIFLASQKIKKMPNLTVIGITGSYGKTTTKDLLVHILSPKYRVVKTEGNYNTPLGIAKTILRNLYMNHEIFVCEMAAYKLGDIKSIAELIKPKIGIITAIGPMHLERFKTRENILKTKMELIESLPENGLGLIPRELEPQINNFKVKTKAVFFNSKEELIFKIAVFFDISSDDVLNRIKTAPPTLHRQEIIKVSGNITIIDDTYNSNPVGFLSALELLKNTTAERKILVTPGMIELGAEQFELNKNAAKSAAQVADYVIIVGETNKKALREGLTEGFNLSIRTKILEDRYADKEYNKRVFEVADLEVAKPKLSELTVPNSAILLENDLPDHYY